MSSWSKHGRRLFPIFLLAFFVHSNILQYWFVASDTLPLIATSRVTNLSEFSDLFTQPLMAGSDFVTTALFFRPIASLSYAIDYAVWGLSPFGYHLTNLLLHALAATLVAVTITTLTTRPAVGSLTAILFAVHPVSVEVVPVTARRQDILLTVFALASITLFIRWYRGLDLPNEGHWKWNNHRAFGGALITYVLALGSKEIAVVVVGLFAVWVMLQQGIARPSRSLRTLASTVGPFIVVTVLYFAYRALVLGGLGGYSGGTVSPSSSTIVDIFYFIIKYALWLTYPLHFLEENTKMLWNNSLSLALLVSFVLLVGGVGLRKLLQRGYFQHGRFHRLRVLSPIVTTIVFITIPIVLRWMSFEPVTLSDTTGVLMSYLIGILFVGACSGVIIMATLLQKSPFSETERKLLVFFGCWVSFPFAGLAASGFVTSKPLDYGFGIRNAYFAVIPTMAILSLLLMPSLRGAWDTAQQVVADHERFSLSIIININVVRAGAILLLVLPVVASSPAFHTSIGWQVAGKLNHQSLFGLQTALENSPNEPFTYIANFPSGFDEQQRPYPHTYSVTPLRQYSIEAWLELQGQTPDTEVRFVRKTNVSTVPENLSFRTEDRDEWTAGWVRWTEDSTQRASVNEHYRQWGGRVGI